MMKTKIKKLAVRVVLIACSVVIVSCGNKQKQNGEFPGLHGTITISGAFALYPMTVAWADSFMKLHPSVKINISAGGAGKGMTDALTGLVDLGMFSRQVTDEEIAKGAFFITVTRDAVLPVANKDNPLAKSILEKGIKRSQLVELFINEKKMAWGDIVKENSKEKVCIYTRSDACGAAEMWGKYLGKDQESLKGIGVFGDPGIADAVRKDKYGLGYNNVIYAYDFKTRLPYEGLLVVPVDLDENNIIDSNENFYQTLDEIMAAIKQNKYPSPPARDLYFISSGKPANQLVIEFLKWILSDGQNMVEQAGYVSLSSEQIEKELQKIK